MCTNQRHLSMKIKTLYYRLKTKKYDKNDSKTNKCANLSALFCTYIDKCTLNLTKANSEYEKMIDMTFSSFFFENSLHL